MAMKAMRSRLMAYTKGMPGGPRLRDRIARVEAWPSSKISPRNISKSPKFSRLPPRDKAMAQMFNDLGRPVGKALPD